jgi:hypothetical protein
MLLRTSLVRRYSLQIRWNRKTDIATQVVVALIEIGFLKVTRVAISHEFSYFSRGE